MQLIFLIKVLRARVSSRQRVRWLLVNRAPVSNRLDSETKIGNIHKIDLIKITNM